MGLCVHMSVFWGVSLRALEVGEERTPSHRRALFSRSFSAEFPFCRGGAGAGMGGTAARPFLATALQGSRTRFITLPGWWLQAL